MSKQRGSSAIGSAQDVGGAEVQRERASVGTVQTADGSRVLLGVVAAGREAGASAERVIEQIFQTVSGAQSNNLATALKRGMEIASQGLARQSDEVSATAVAIRRNRLFFANAGNNAVLRVAGNEAIRLTEPSDRWLGAQESPRIQSGPEAGLTLRRGDRVVITSAGLLEKSPIDEKPFVDRHEIPEHIKSLPPEDAAKLLVSIALGRDVGGNVSVVVLGEARETRKFPIAALAGVGVIGLLLLVAGALTLLSTPSGGVAIDFGFAVLVRGGVLVDTGDGAPTLAGNLETIPTGAALTAQTDAALAMQSTHENSAELTRGSVYLEQGAQTRLSEIDPRIDGEGSRRTSLELDDGSMLISRQSGTWEYRVLAITDHAALIGAGAGVMGVETSGGSMQLDCLIGLCRYESPTGEEFLLDAGDRVLVGASSGIVHESAIPTDSSAHWNELCDGCVGENP